MLPRFLFAMDRGKLLKSSMADSISSRQLPQRSSEQALGITWTPCSFSEVSAASVIGKYFP